MKQQGFLRGLSSRLFQIGVCFSLSACAGGQFAGSIPLIPGLSAGISLGQGGISVNMQGQAGPVGVGVGVDPNGKVGGQVGVMVGR